MNSAVMQTLYENPLHAVYNVDSTVFYIKAAILKIKYLLSTGVKQPAFSDAHKNL